MNACRFDKYTAFQIVNSSVQTVVFHLRFPRNPPKAPILLPAVDVNQKSQSSSFTSKHTHAHKKTNPLHKYVSMLILGGCCIETATEEMMKETSGVFTALCSMITNQMKCAFSQHGGRGELCSRGGESRLKNPSIRFQPQELFLNCSPNHNWFSYFSIFFRLFPFFFKSKPINAINGGRLGWLLESNYKTPGWMEANNPPF